MTDYDDDLEPEEPAIDQPAGQEKDWPKIVERLKRDKEKAEAKVEKAREEAYAKAQEDFERKSAAVGMAAELDLKPGLVTRFLKENTEGEVTKEALSAYAEELGISVKKAEGEESEPEAAPTPPPFHTPGAAPQGQKISYEQYRQMVTTGSQHAEAIRMRQAGLVADPER